VVGNRGINQATINTTNIRRLIFNEIMICISRKNQM